MSKIIHVAAGVIIKRPSASETVEILLAKRPAHTHKGGLWEFPGGKVEAEELVQDALARELAEELAITVEESSSLLQVPYAYPEKTVLLDVWLVTAFSGKPQGNEGQVVKWVKLADLKGYAFPEANTPIVEFLQAFDFGPMA